MSVNSRNGTATSQGSKDSRSTAARERDMLKANLKGSSKATDHRPQGRSPKLETSGNSGKWERYEASEASVSMVSDASRRPAQARAQSACSGSRKSSGSAGANGSHRNGGYKSHRQDHQYAGTPIPESICSSAIESLRRGSGSVRRSSRADSKADSRDDSKMGSQRSGASGQRSRQDGSQCDNSAVSGSQHRPASAPSRSSASRRGSEAPSSSYYTYDSQASSRNPTSTELAMANRMRQQRRIKSGRVFEGKTAYRETFKALPLEERISVPRGLMMHMQPEWIPAGSTDRNTSTSRAHFANQTVPDVRAAGSSTALEVSPLICDW